MATLTFKPPYTYVPTPPRSKSVATSRKPAPKQGSLVDKFQHIRSSSSSLSTPPPAAPAGPAVAAADDDGTYRPGIRGTDTVYSSSDKEIDGENDDDDRDLPTIEDLLFTKLQEQGSAAASRNSGHRDRGVEEAAAEERVRSVDRNGPAPGDKSGGSLADPIVLQGDNDSSTSDAEVNDNGLRAESAAPGAGLFDSPETAIDSTTPAPPCSSDGWHDIDDFPETAPRLPLAEQGASTSNSTHPRTPSSRLSSERLHDRISTEGSRHASSEATTCSSSPPPRHCSASPETQLSQKGRLHTGRGVADEHGLIGPSLDISSTDEEVREQQEVEQDDKDNDEDGPQQEVNDVAAAATAERAVGTHIPGKEDGSPRSVERQQSLPNREPSPEPSQDGTGSDSRSDDKLNNTALDDDDEEPRPMKRKRPTSSCDGPTRKKHEHRLQQMSTRQHRPRSKPHGRSPKSHSPLDQASRVAAVSTTEGRLPLSGPSAHAMDTDMSPDCCNLDRSSGAALPTLTEVTFRPHSLHCCSFAAVIRDGCAERGVSFSQVARLIASIGHVGKIEDFTIKPVEQHSFLVTGFSQHTSSQPTFGGTALSTVAEARRDHVDAVAAKAPASRRCEPSNGGDDSGLSDSDPDSSSNDDGCLSEVEQVRSSTSKHSRWPSLDEQRLLAYKKEGKSWEWIFGKFPGRTAPSIRTRWNMIRPRGD